MSKKSRKMKWKGVALNHSNIDEYMKDLIEDTAGQYITQGVSFNKEDNFQMNLLKNSILAHGSFSGFVKNLLFAYFEKNGSIDESVWQPNNVDEIMESEGTATKQFPLPPTPINDNLDHVKNENANNEVIINESVAEQIESHEKELSATDEELKEEQSKPVEIKPKVKKNRNNDMMSAFITPQEED